MKKCVAVLLTLCLSAAVALPAAALEYTIVPPAEPAYGVPTSVEVIHTADEGAASNEDLSKNTAHIPPSFGSPIGVTAEFITGGNSPVFFPSAPVTNPHDYTPVTDGLYYSDGSLGTLQIPVIGVDVPIYQGTDSDTLALGAGHFIDSSLLDGTVALAGHNRGAHECFGAIHLLKAGDSIVLSTKLGTRYYAVNSVSMVHETDRSALIPTSEDRIILYTCVRDQSSLRWCIQATAV